LITDVYEGKLNQRTAGGLAPLMSLQSRAIEAASLEQRVENVEKQPVAKVAADGEST
jgi:hypothetical protein